MARIEPQPLGDQAALVYLPDESAAWRLAEAARAGNVSWRQDVVQAYASVAVFFDLSRINFAGVADWLKSLDYSASAAATPRSIALPCCYEMGPDLARVADHVKRSIDDVIARHLATEYTVYAIGFCPGFPYLGYLPPELCGVPRLPAPRVRVEPGSVGLTGRQTGVYPLARPGGWNLIGRTPLELVHVADEYFPLRVGDRVRFERIDEVEFRQRLGQRLD
ncbi:MAG: allophanate hydrolase subunit 1 [Gemmataceae bacterium]